MATRRSQKPVLTSRATFDRVLSIAQKLIDDGSMVACVRPDGSLDYEVAREQIEAAVSGKPSAAEFRRVFDTEVRAAIWLLLAEVPERQWHLHVPDMSDDEQDDWRGRVRSVSASIDVADLKSHFRYKTRGVLPKLSAFRTEVLATQCAGCGKPAKWQAVVSLDSEVPRLSLTMQGAGSFVALREALGVTSGTTLTVSLDARDVDYIIMRLQRVRDEITKGETQDTCATDAEDVGE